MICGKVDVERRVIFFLPQRTRRKAENAEESTENAEENEVHNVMLFLLRRIQRETNV